MCGGKVPKPVKQDPEADADRAAAEAAAAANTDAARRARTRRAQALTVSQPGTLGAGSVGSALDYGKSVLGG